MKVDAITKRWIRNAADERAAAGGCRFDEERGQFVVDWIQDHLRLYEGDWAGEPFNLLPWFYDATMRCYGWVKQSEKWKRRVRRFRQASIWVPKKNAKSPGLAAWGMYLLAGDGEQGQKVYLAAKDGQQSREISGKHAIEMCQSSESLMEECSINRSLMQITHEPTRSILKPLSSNDSRSQQAKEGLNGSVLVDETHVVDRAFMNRISRAGISRSEPLMAEFSTAGNNPDGYGKSRYDYGHKVNDGTFEDESLLFICYEAPQDVSDRDLAADPVKYGKMANPSWGHTIDPDEFLDDYKRSCRELSDMLLFKMYRLNIWQQSSNPWLRASDWDRCKLEFTEGQLHGRECWMGLDLSRTRDMSAAVLIFQSPFADGEYVQLPYFWLPEDYAREHSHLASFEAWHKNGYLAYSPGATINQRCIYEKISQLAEIFNIQRVVYDPRYAEEITADIESNLNIERMEFKQSMMDYMTPTADYERLVCESKLRHNNHPILNWQAGHVEVRIDVNNNKRPVKPSSDDYRKVDGITAGIMALREAIVGDMPKSIYSEPAEDWGWG